METKVFAEDLDSAGVNGEERMLDDSTQPVSLFVYGTLMPGQGNHRRIECFVHRARPGRIHGVLVDLGAFPALIPGEGLVKGILLDIDLSALGITDQIEGYAPNRSDCLYIRKQIIVTLDDETRVKAWTYEFAAPQRILDHPRMPMQIIDDVVAYAWPMR